MRQYEGRKASQSSWTTSASKLWDVSYAPDDSYFGIVGSSSKVFMYNATNRADTLEQLLETNSTSDLYSADFSYDSNFFATGNLDGVVYLFSRFCQGCPSGTYPNQTYCRACYLDIPACALCKNSSVCYGCNGGYYLSGTSCSSCDIMEGCATCNSSLNCTTCLPGFYKAGLTCSRCYTPLPGCLQCSTALICSQCDTLYFLTLGGKCSSCSSNCIYCNSSSFCLDCIVGFYPLAGVCTPCASPCLIC